MLPYTLIIAALSLSVVFATKAKTCEPYPYVELENGSVRRSGHMKYTFHCDKGYTLLFSKNPTVRCRHGRWTPSEEPKCYRKEGTCDDPPVVANANVYGEERHRGATVKYVCKEGYTLLGHSELSCTRSGYWDKRVPTCMEESEPIQNVAERLSNSFVTTIANYSADTPEGRSLDEDSIHLGLELYIVIDRSSSVDPVQLEGAKRFVKFLLHRFAVRNGENNERGTRASVIAFGTEVQRIFNVYDKNISNPTLAALAVDTIQPNGGGTNLEGAFYVPIYNAEDGLLRKDAKRAVFLMTDGEPNIANPDITPQDVAKILKNNHDFEIFTVGIGKGINMHLLNELASEPPLSHVFMLEDYSNLNDIMKVIQSVKPKPPPISKDQCGYNATGENQPWTVVIYIGGTPFKVCGGVLICSQWVLTAASCLQEDHDRVNMKDVFVVLGERNLLRQDKSQTNFYVVEMRIHPRHDPEKLVRDDLALLKIQLPENEMPRYRPACLPLTDRAVPMHLNLEINASIAGWGKISAAPITWARADDISLFQMFKTPVSLSEENECPVRKRGLTALCAGQGSRACYGLLGSPLIAQDPSTGFLHALGILAYRTKCVEGQNQYVELTKYLPWINQETKDCQLKHWGLTA